MSHDMMFPGDRSKRRWQGRAATYETGTRVSIANVSNPPTDAQLDAAFGTPATVGAGFVAIVDDAGAHTAEYIVWSDGTSWWWAGGTKAV